MTVLSAQSIREQCKLRPGELLGDWQQPMVSPFHERTEVVYVNDEWRLKKTELIEWIDCPVFSYGLSSAGYDVRIAEDIWLWPFYGRLASTIEHFNIPDNVLAEIADKSSWIRRFVILGNSKAEPGWRGYLTLELMRWLPWPIRIRAGTPIAHIVFHKLDKPTDQPYVGKYQDAPRGAQKAI